MDCKLHLGPLPENRRWGQIDLRDDDLIVATPPKSGTTWMQTITALLIWGDPDIDLQLAVKQPWIDMRMREIEEVAERVQAVPHRRSLKSHTPLDGLPVGDKGHFISVFRLPLDAHFSFRKLVRNLPNRFFDHWYPEDDPDRIAFKRFLDGGAQGFDTDPMPLAHTLRHYSSALSLKDRAVSLCRYVSGSAWNLCARRSRGKRGHPHTQVTPPTHPMLIQSSGEETGSCRVRSEGGKYTSDRYPENLRSGSRAPQYRG